MEREISRPGVNGVTVAARILGTFSGALFAISAYAGGGGGGTPSGALEVTQLANNAELVAQVGQAIQTTANTLMSAQATMQMLRQLPDAIISESMSGLPIDKVQALADAYVVFSSAVNDYKAAEDVLRKAVQDAKELNISPAELLRRKATVASRFGGVYETAYKEEEERIKRLAQTAKDIQRQAEVVKTIDANVAGIQFLASQNVKLQATLSEISSAISKANTLAYEEAKRTQNENSEYYNREAAFDEQFRKNQQRDRAASEALSTDGLIPRKKN